MNSFTAIIYTPIISFIIASSQQRRAWLIDLQGSRACSCADMPADACAAPTVVVSIVTAPAIRTPERVLFL